MAEDPTILVIGPRWVGDMVMAQCLFSALRQRFPAAAIDVMAPRFTAPLVRRMPEIRNFIEDPLPRGRIGFGRRRSAGRLMRGAYSHAYVMQGNWKSALIPYFAEIPQRTGYLKELRYGLLNNILPLDKAGKRQTAQIYFALAEGGTFRNPSLRVDADNRNRLLAEHDLKRDAYITLMPGAEFGPAKRWPPAKYAEFAQRMMADNVGIVLLGSARDGQVADEIAKSAPGVIDLTGMTSLEDAIDILAGARLAVSNDSGLMHVAAAVGTPVLAIYGSTSPHNTPPLTETSELVWLGLDCSPCHKRECPLGHLDCLNRLDVSRVLAAADRLMQPDRQPE